jgi:hypothetical protein
VAEIPSLLLGDRGICTLRRRSSRVLPFSIWEGNRSGADVWRPIPLSVNFAGSIPGARFLLHPPLGHPHQIASQMDALTPRRGPQQAIDPLAHKEADLAIQGWGAPLEARIAIESPLILLTRNEPSHGDFSGGLGVAFRDERIVTRASRNGRCSDEDMPAPKTGGVLRDEEANSLIGTRHCWSLLLKHRVHARVLIDVREIRLRQIV